MRRPLTLHVGCAQPPLFVIAPATIAEVPIGRFVSRKARQQLFVRPLISAFGVLLMLLAFNWTF